MSNTKPVHQEGNTVVSDSTFANYTTNPHLESTVIEQPSMMSVNPSGTGKKVVVKKKKNAKPVLSAKEKKERSVRSSIVLVGFDG